MLTTYQLPRHSPGMRNRAGGKGLPAVSCNSPSSHCLHRDAVGNFTACKTELGITCLGVGCYQTSGHSTSHQGQGGQGRAGSGARQKVVRENTDQGPSYPQQGRKEGWGAHHPPFVPLSPSSSSAAYLSPTVDLTGEKLRKRSSRNRG